MIGIRAAVARLGAGLPATFWWLWAGALVNALASFVFPFLALFLTSRGFDLERTGLIVAMFGGGSIVAAPVAGFLADHFGRRPTLILSLVATALVTAALVALTAPLAIAVAVLALGLVAHAFRPPLNAMIADVVAPAERARAYGLVYWAVNLGMAIALVGGGVLAGYGYGKLFLADAATTLLFAALVWRNVPESHPGPAGARDLASTEKAGGGGYAQALRDGPFTSLLAVQLAFLLVFWQFQVTAPVDMARHGLGPAAYGRVLAVNGLLIATLQPFSARLSRRFDAAYVLAAASVLVAVGYGSYALCTRSLAYAAATAVWTVGEILCLPVAAALVADLSPPDLRGRYQGAYGLTFGLGALVAPILGSTVMQRLGAQTLWAGCLTLGLAVAAAHLAIAGPRRRALVLRLRDQPATAGLTA